MSIQEDNDFRILILQLKAQRFSTDQIKQQLKIYDSVEPIRTCEDDDLLEVVRLECDMKIASIRTERLRVLNKP